jgi:hypothetical protein
MIAFAAPFYGRRVAILASTMLATQMNSFRRTCRCFLFFGVYRSAWRVLTGSSAAADVLADLGPAGQEAVRAKLKGTTDALERIMLQEALDDAQKSDYRPILQYPLNAGERANIRGCK